MGIGFKELLVILVVVLLIFGTKKLRSLGGDLGSAIKDFKKNISDDKVEEKSEDTPDIATKTATAKTGDANQPADCCDHDHEHQHNHDHKPKS